MLFATPPCTSLPLFFSNVWAPSKEPQVLPPSCCVGRTVSMGESLLLWMSGGWALVPKGLSAEGRCQMVAVRFQPCGSQCLHPPLGNIPSIHFHTVEGLAAPKACRAPARDSGKIISYCCWSCGSHLIRVTFPGASLVPVRKEDCPLPCHHFTESKIKALRGDT